MTARRPLTARDRASLLREIAAGKVTRNPETGEDWRATARFEPGASGFANRSGDVLGKKRVSAKDLDLLVSEGVAELQGGVWQLTGAGRGEAEVSVA